MNKFATVALVAATSLGLSVMPALGADTDKSVKEKAADTKDTVKEKTSNAWDKTKEKTSEAWDKTKEKTAEAKDKIKAKVSGDKTAGKAGGEDVRQAQMALKDKGYDPGPIDGVQGPRTTAALRDYQKAENIKVTGRLDAETKSHLMGGQASSKTSRTAPSASPSTTAPSASPSTGSPSAASPSSPPVPPPAATGSPSAPSQDTTKK